MGNLSFTLTFYCDRRGVGFWQFRRNHREHGVFYFIE